MMKENLQLPPRSIADKKMNHDSLPPQSTPVLHIYASLRKIPHCEHAARVTEEKLKLMRSMKEQAEPHQELNKQDSSDGLVSSKIGAWGVSLRMPLGVGLSPPSRRSPEQLSDSAEAGMGTPQASAVHLREGLSPIFCYDSLWCW